MKKNKTILILIVIILGITIGTFYYFYTQNSNNNEQKNYEATRTSTNENTDNNTNNNSNNAANTTEANENGDATTNNTNTEQQTPPTETTLSTFSTKIYTKESARQNNINITCSSLNDTIVKAGDTFSFCSTVGQATTAKGYQKADIFDKNGNKKKGLRWWKLSSK